MTKRHWSAVGVVCLFGLLTMIAGCSENDTIIADISDSPQTTSLATYFPTSDGYRTTYQVTSSNGSSELIRFKIDGTSSLQGVDMLRLVAEMEDGSRDTSYLKITSQAVYMYETDNGKPETILQTPLKVGHSWSRFDENSPETDSQADTVSISLGFLDNILKGEGTVRSLNDADGSNYKGYYDPLAAKVFPTQGRVQMRVQAVEDINLSSGDHYSYVLRLSNVQQSGLANYYWYAPGVGLVRYALGVSAASYPDGDVVGELLAFGQ